MKTLTFEQMEQVEGSISKAKCESMQQSLAVIGLIAGIGSAFGPIGLAIFGPTAIGVSIISTVCAYK